MENKENNELIALFMGYKYRYSAEEDYSDCGGLYTIVQYYSNQPLAFEYYSKKDDEPHFRAIFPKDYLTNNDFKYIAIEISGYPSFVLDRELKYHESWDWLMPVYIKINKLIQNKSNYDFKFGYEVDKLHLNMWNILESENCNINDFYITIVEFVKWYNEKR